MESEASTSGRVTKLTIGGVILAAAIFATLAVPVAMQSEDQAEAAELARFADCTAMRAYLNESAAASAVTGGQNYAPPLVATGEAATADARALPAAGAARGSALGTDAAQDTGATNVQVAGVDELDVTDTDGRLLVTVADRAPADGDRPHGALLLVDPASARVVDTESLPGWSHQLTWDPSGGVVWVASSDAPGSGSDGVGGSTTRITRVRITGNGLEVDGTSEIRGSLVGARRVGNRLHVVASDGGTVVTAVPGAAGSPQRRVQDDEAPTLDAPGSLVPRQHVIERLPFEGGDITVPCDQVWHPAGPSQPSALLVASFDAAGNADGGRLPAEVAEIAGAGSLLYGTAGALYVATTLWDEQGTTTGVHRFALDGLRWTGSGRVPGIPLNQFAFDEHAGILRVATTVDLDRPAAVDISEDDLDVGGSQGTSADLLRPERDGVDNLVVSLDTEGDLEEVGRLGGLGHPGERIQGVRFAGETAYVVTFRRTDPLYVLDLSDPRQPRASGELQLPGFSSYLHPVDEALLVGIGRAGTEGGALLGAQAQLFDVSDPQMPRLVDQEPLGDNSPAAEDHHAFAALEGNSFAVPMVDWPGGAMGGRPEASDVAATPAAPIPEGSLPEMVPVAPPAVSVVRMAASGQGLDRTGEFKLDAPADSNADFITGSSIRTVPVNGRIAIVVGSVGVALFEVNGTSSGWILFG